MRTIATEPEIKQAIDDFIQRLRSGIQVEAVILYGSYAQGTPNEWSDFDLAIISPDFEGMPLWRRQQVLSRLSINCHPRLSPIGYSSAEYHKPSPASFLAEIIRTGKVVYQDKE